MGDGLLDCTTVIITDIPIFKNISCRKAIESSPPARLKAGLSTRNGSPPISRRPTD
jgi:hypothetical protein